jgi:hypothetical protein
LVPGRDLRRRLYAFGPRATVAVEAHDLGFSSVTHDWKNIRSSGYDQSVLLEDLPAIYK